MADDTERSIALTRTGKARFRATNVRGGTLELGEGDDADFTPVELLLVAAATCTAADVVSILEKERVALRSLEIAVHGTRRQDHPRRYTAINFHFTIAGAGADEPKARRAIDLSLTKYCSVVASLAPDTAIAYDVAIGH